MRILYVEMKHDYGDPELGPSTGHYYFYDCLHNMGHDVLYFDFMGLMARLGREGMNRRLLEVATSERPELMFSVLFRDELDQDTVRQISEMPDTTTLNWFCDDHWRFESFTSRWAPCFNWSATTATSALPKYERIGYRNVLKTQWACNHFYYRRKDLPLKYDVTFVGRPHGTRREVIERLRRAGVDVRVWGRGWEEGRISQDEMIDVFSQSRINLNLSNASTAKPGWWRRVRRAARGLVGGAPSLQRHDQIKGRNFEVPGCGGFLLSGLADNLADYYDIGREIACFDGDTDLVGKVRYYLDHEGERAGIARAGYARTLREHTFAHRFTDLFQRMGLPCDPVSVFADGVARPGATVEIA